jgi:hypothetical protein
VDHLVHEERLGDIGTAFWVLLPFQYGALIGTLVLVYRAHPLAPTLAAALTAGALLAFTGAHLLPSGPLPYSEGDPPAISWALIFVPMAVAAATLVTALRWRYADGAVARRHGRVSGSGVSTGSSRSRSGS